MSESCQVADQGLNPSVIQVDVDRAGAILAGSCRKAGRWGAPSCVRRRVRRAWQLFPPGDPIPTQIDDCATSWRTGPTNDDRCRWAVPLTDA
jgi:hypothetical protein